MPRRTLTKTPSSGAPSTARRLQLQLGVLDAAGAPGDMDLAGWRLTFRFVGTDAEVVDYQGRAAVSAELAIRLAAALGSSAESWLRMQLAYDLWHAQKKRRPKIQRLRQETAAARDNVR